MALNVGSMLVTLKCNVSSMQSAIANVILKLKGTEVGSKSLNAELKRMKGTLVGIAAMAGLTAGGLLAGITAAVMQSPFLAAELAKLKVEFRLLGDAIAKHVAPILNKFVGLVRWLREKFTALPESVQSTIVKIIVFGAIILGLLTIIGGFILALGGVSTALGVLIPAGLVATITAFGTGIWALVAGSLLLQAALGLLLGGLVVIAMDKFGLLDWISDIGEGFRNWDSIIRDIIVSVLGLTGVVSGVILDLSHGDLNFSQTKGNIKQWTDSMGRVKGAVLGGSTYGEGSSTSATWSRGASGVPGGQNIGTQSNDITINAGGITGDWEDPGVQDEFLDILLKGLSDRQETTTV